MRKLDCGFKLFSFSMVLFSVVQIQNSRANEDKDGGACRKALTSTFGLVSVEAPKRIQDCSVEELRNAAIGTRVSTTIQNGDRTTRIGAIFERVQFERFKYAWRQISADGLTKGAIWTERIGEFTNDDVNGRKSGEKRM